MADCILAEKPVLFARDLRASLSVDRLNDPEGADRRPHRRRAGADSGEGLTEAVRPRTAAAASTVVQPTVIQGAVVGTVVEGEMEREY